MWGADVTMDRMFSISDNESETSDETADSEAVSQPASQLEHALTVPDIKLSGEPGSRVRVLSESEVSLGRSEEPDLNNRAVSDEGGGGGAGDGTHFRTRSQSAPPALWAAQRYGRQLRRMSDEFDTLLDKGMKRVRSAGAARQMQASPSWFAFLWSHKESEAEISSGGRAAQ
ncbi:bcl2 antagonist of cell death-like [Scleropages formosus]|uniref:Bcl2 antagonist of cell death-like n=1 Tax=Scleropages formosus TaxID=113540 RepID=A0A0P7XMX0_SCLFO|nr:bcl2 antagonist of cell death-like [Scleropages formosus]